MDQLTQTLQILTLSFKINLHWMLHIIAWLWGIQLLNKLLRYRLNALGIYPRSFFGLIGIIFSPVLHADFRHLFFNTIPLFVLMSLILVAGKTLFIHVTAMIWLLSGFGIWLLGRKALHIGASGIIMGFWSYLLISTVHQNIWMAVILGVICIYYFGGLLTSIFPFEKNTSWEGHLMGFLAGIITSYIYPF